MSNLFTAIPQSLSEELVEVLAESSTTRIERIVSRGHASPPDFWYDQPRPEFVVLLSGAARLRFEDEDEARTLGPGDHVLIPARARHRVEWTAEDVDSVWLAVHFDSPE